MNAAEVSAPINLDASLDWSLPHCEIWHFFARMQDCFLYHFLSRCKYAYYQEEQENRTDQRKEYYAIHFFACSVAHSLQALIVTCY